MLRIFAIAVAVQLVLLPGLTLLGVALSPVGLFPVAQMVGGIVFGAGMALAGGCITGILWKTGAGSIATAVAIAGFALGELLVRGPGAEVLGVLDRAAARPQGQTLHDALGLPYGALSALAWLAADWVGAGYGLGFTGTAENVPSAPAGDQPSTRRRLTVEPRWGAIPITPGGCGTMARHVQAHRA